MNETATTAPGPAPASTSASGSAVSVKGLVKRYDQVEAVQGIEFEVAGGEIFGFLGPNGAGKSTTINMLCTLVRRARAPRWSPATTWSQNATRSGATSAWSSRTRRSTAT